MKYYAGVDIGSMTTATTIIDESAKIVSMEIVPTGANAITAGELSLDMAKKRAGISDADLAATLATGYGRVAFPKATASKTEITCQAFGCARLFPNAKEVVDIGGQDAKVIRIGENGKILDFAMNDKCAAGTGRFLEIMAAAIGVKIGELGAVALASEKESPISSTCAVFAESEVVGLLGRGEPFDAVAKGVHRSVCQRFAAMIKRVGVYPPIVLTGGGARNAAIAAILAEELKLPPSDVLIPEIPQHTCSLGAALLALKG